MRGDTCREAREARGNNRSVMPFDGSLGRTRATMPETEGVQVRADEGSSSVPRGWDRRLQLSVVNPECLVSACHHRALNASPPFVHTARRSYRLDVAVSCPDALRKPRDPPRLEEGEVVTRFP